MSHTAPVLFVGHGSPTNAIGDNPARRGWIDLGKKLEKPKAILSISAHWMVTSPVVRRSEENPQVYDFYGFPQALYEVKYTPKGDLSVAERVVDLVPGCVVDNTWGLDHGAWSVLASIFPDADVPVVPFGVDNRATPRELFEIGQALKPLRDEGVMIVASGNVVHNLRRVDWGSASGFDWADAFDKKIGDFIKEKDFDGVIDYRLLPEAPLAVPTPDHFYPLFYALGAVDQDDSVEVFNDYRELGSMSMTSYLFHR